MGGMLKSVWQYRGFVLSSIRNDMVSRFAQSKLGGLWVILNPLSQVLIYALILSNILAAKLPGIDNKYAYSIYLMSGLLAWTLFSESVSRCLTLFIDNGNLMKKMNFPRITLPSIVIGSCLLNNLLLFVAMLAIFLALGHEFTAAMFWLIPLTLCVVTLGFGIGLILGVLNVFMRDIGQVVPIILQVMFWFTPIVYPLDIIPVGYRDMMSNNPLYHLIDGYHQVVVYGHPPALEGIVIVLAISLILVALGLFMFKRAGAEMMDVL